MAVVLVGGVAPPTADLSITGGPLFGEPLCGWSSLNQFGVVTPLLDGKLVVVVPGVPPGMVRVELVCGHVATGAWNAICGWYYPTQFGVPRIFTRVIADWIIGVG